jgi:hypothetical protein
MFQSPLVARGIAHGLRSNGVAEVGERHEDDDVLVDAIVPV